MNSTNQTATPAQHRVTEKCKGCGTCIEVCPNLVIELFDNYARTNPNRAEQCILCGACVAVCPNRALQLDSLPMDGFSPLNPWKFQFEELMAMLESRRSIRIFKDKPVERHIIEQVLKATATAPMGFPPHTTQVLVIENKNEREHLFNTLIKDYQNLVDNFKNPLVRQIIRYSAGTEDFHALDTHIIGIATDATKRQIEHGDDRYTYHAPVVLLFHANRWDIAYKGNGYIAATYAMLAAHALGLGTTMLDIVAPIVNRSRELKQRWSIPKDNVVVVSMVLGHPKYKYAQSIKRELKEVRYL